MASIFTRIINGEVPARFVWKDELCVAFMSINPLTPGHALVVPRVEVDHWLDLEAAVMGHLVHAAQHIGRAQQIAFQPEKVALMIAGLEVRHVHLHLVPIEALHDLDFDRQARDPDPVALDAAASRIRAALRDLGRQDVPEERGV
jgi:histidine triad (HIT) family protein